MTRADHLWPPWDRGAAGDEHEEQHAAALAVASLGAAGTAHAEITVRFVTSQSGPGSSIGVLHDRGMKAAVEYASSVATRRSSSSSEPTTDRIRQRRRAMRVSSSRTRCPLIGTATRCPSIAMVAVANELKVPMISISPITVPVMTDTGDRWRIAMPLSHQPDGHGRSTSPHARRHQTLAYISASRRLGRPGLQRRRSRWPTA